MIFGSKIGWVFHYTTHWVFHAVDLSYVHAQVHGKHQRPSLYPRETKKNLLIHQVIKVYWHLSDSLIAVWDCYRWVTPLSMTGQRLRNDLGKCVLHGNHHLLQMTTRHEFYFCTCSSTATLNSCQIQFSRPWKFSLHILMSMNVNVLEYFLIHLEIYMYT